MPDMTTSVDADPYDDLIAEQVTRQTSVLRDIRLLLIVITVAVLVGLMLGVWAAFGNLPL